MKVKWKANRSLWCALVWQVLFLVGLGRIYFQSLRNVDATIKTSSMNEDASWLPPPLPSGPALSADSVRDTCFPLNTAMWLNDTHRTSNNAKGFTPPLLDALMEGPTRLSRLSEVFDQTLCHSAGPLRSISPLQQTSTSMSTSSTKGEPGAINLGTVEDWYHRFLYLTMHWRFHQPAREEYFLRRQCLETDARQGTRHVESFMEQHNIGQMDFECSIDQKFIVVPVGSIGFGAFLNTQATLSILLALQTGRIPIFSVGAFFPWQTQWGRTTDPWLLAPTKCDRKDMQCYFLPPSPCTVTSQELRDAPIWGSTALEQRWFIKDNLVLPPELEGSRVVVVNSGLSVKSQGAGQLRQVASSVIQQLMREWKEHYQTEKGPDGTGLLWSDEDWRAMELAHRWLVEKAESDPLGLIRHVYTYLLRPNPHYKALLQARMSEILPADEDPSQTVGFAIRGSDKCISESTCLPFSRYMELATDVAYPSLPRKDGQRPRLIMTTEDAGIFNQSLSYQHNKTFPFEFLVNDQDNMQGSGYPKEFKNDGENTIVSSLTALLMHLSAGRVYLNCCSNFHVVLSQLLQAQCGARRHGHDFVYQAKNGTTSTENEAQDVFPPKVAYCLNDEKVPLRYRICCSWSKGSVGDSCKEIWETYNADKASFFEREGNPKKGISK